MNSHINNEIKIFNRKLYKLAKFFSHVNVMEVENNRQLFTTHGLHLNRLGNELLSSCLLFHIHSVLKEDKGTTISLAWPNSHSQNKQAMQDQDIYHQQLVTDKRNPCRTSIRRKRPPVIRNDDYLW